MERESPVSETTVELEVPGRLCLFGEHSDWAGGYRATHPELHRGYCLATGTDQTLAARAEWREGVFEISSVLPGGGPVPPLEVELRAETLAQAATEGGFYSYAAGVVAELAARGRVRGLRLEVVRAELPIQKGLSSSAAICVLVARAFSRVHGLGLSVRTEMELAYRGERRAGSECGRMDQICAFGRRPTLLTFDGDELEIEPLTPGAAVTLLVVDLKTSKSTRRILADLNRCFPDTPGPIPAAVRSALGPRNAELVHQARQALFEGDGRGIGELMSQAQARFDREIAPACPELQAPRLHQVLEHPAVKEFAWGGKGVGSQGDGCAQLVARGPEERDALAARLESELGVACLPLTIQPDEEPSPETLDGSR
jgi:galactokinase